MVSITPEIYCLSIPEGRDMVHIHGPDEDIITGHQRSTWGSGKNHRVLQMLYIRSFPKMPQKLLMTFETYESSPKEAIGTDPKIWIDAFAI